MKSKEITLDKLCVGEKGIVKYLTSNGIIRRRMLDLGLIDGTQVEALQKSPSGDPVAYSIRGAVIALRCEDAVNVVIEYCH